MKNEKLMTILYSIVTLMLYFGWILLTQVIFSNGITSSNLLINFLISVLFLGLFIFLYRHKLKSDFNLFVKEKIYNKIFVYSISVVAFFLIILGTFKICGFNYTFNILEEIKLMPLVGLFKVLVFASIVEEIVFRVVFKNAIYQKSLFILTSVLTYGILHVIFYTTGIELALTMLPFIVSGLVLSLVYIKYDNLILNICISFLCNVSFLLILMI